MILFSLFCEDVRAEQGNKFSFMGVYDQKILVPGFPATLPKLCFVIFARTPVSQPFQQLKFRLFKNDDLIGELEPAIPDMTIDPAALGQEVTDSPPAYTVRAVLQLGMLSLDGPCHFKVRAFAENEEPLCGGVLRIEAISESTIKPSAPSSDRIP